ncbi:alpha/beta hydrolase-fold protein [uncultured Campylobacter sp.]|uniref:alpha/beta hydrolase n=1 Tax=uncultured Campylobacter sp. TaxID=218934 RepID=UPI00262BA389|nr:alpha/beta hydrolase-fold protein [uncultured Campylobacter sp.]
MVSLKSFLVVFDALFLACLFACDLGAKPPQKIERVSGAAREMFNVSDFILKSKSGEKYKIFIARQKNVARYDRVVFMVDANAQFPILLNSYAKIYANGAKQNAKAVPKLSKTVLIVGIGYDSPLAYDTKRRTRDLTPAASGEKYANGGGAAEFYDFVKDELFPLVEKKYSTAKSDKIYFGHSFGGLFGIYALLRDDGIFDEFFIASPSLWWGESQLIRDALDEGKLRSNLKAKFIMLVAGSREMRKGKTDKAGILKVADLAKILKTKGLSCEFRLYEGASHGEVIPLALQDLALFTQR